MFCKEAWLWVQCNWWDGWKRNNKGGFQAAGSEMKLWKYGRQLYVTGSKM